MNVRVVIRADASLQIGAGHVIRCMTLADELRNRGAQVTFVCRDLPGNLNAVLKESGYSTVILPGIYAQTMACSAAEEQEGVSDAKQTIKGLKESRFDWVIVDHYHLDECWEMRLRPYAKHLLVVDDLADRMHVCDVLLDPTYGGTADRYRGYLNAEALSLCGSQFAILRPQFLSFRPVSARNTSLIEKMRVHVFFGSSDLAGHTFRFSRLLLENFEGLRISAVVGQKYGPLDQLQCLANEFEGRFLWQQDVSEMAASMGECDVALGAPGGATWERAALGLPSVYLAVSHSQKRVLENLESSGLCRYLGPADEMTSYDFIKGMRDYLSDSNGLGRMSELGMRAVDAKGVLRVADAMEQMS